MKRLLLASALAFAVGSPALADTFQADSFSQPNGFQDITVTLGALTETVRAGEIDLHQNIPAADLLVWCLDLNDILHVPYTFQEHTLTAGQNPARSACRRPGRQPAPADRLADAAWPHAGRHRCPAG